MIVPCPSIYRNRTRMTRITQISTDYLFAFLTGLSVNLLSGILKSLANRQISPYCCAMVKKLFLSVFTLALFAAFSGVPVIMHYCSMNGMTAKSCNMCATATVEEPAEDESTDSCCESEEQQEPEQSPHSFTADMSCCHSDIISAPIKIDQEISSLDIIKKAPVQADADFNIDIPNARVESVSLQTQLVDRAPPITQPPIRILTSSYLI